MMLFTCASIIEFMVNIDLIDSYKVAGALLLPFSQANNYLATLLEGIQYSGCMYVSRSICALSVSQFCLLKSRFNEEILYTGKTLPPFYFCPLP